MSGPLDRLEQDNAEWLLRELGPDPVTNAIAGWIQARFARIAELREMEVQFERRYHAAMDEEERRRAILDLARRMGASDLLLAGDRQALDLYFDRDAVVERARRRVGQEERAAVFGLGRLGGRGTEAVSNSEAAKAIETAWAYNRDARMREAALRCIRQALEQAKSAELGEQLLWQIQRVALDPREVTWVQTEALTILAMAAPASAIEAARRRFSEPGGGDDLFVRRHLVRLVAAAPTLAAARPDLLQLAAADPSPAVRQSVADEIWRCDHDAEKALAARLASDTHPKVRAMLLVRSPRLGTAGLTILVEAISSESDSFVLRTALRTASEWAWASDLTAAADLERALAPAVARLRDSHLERRVRAWAAAGLERLWCAADAGARDLAELIRASLARVPEGRTMKVPGVAEAAAEDQGRVGRVLAVLAQEGFGLELLAGGRIRRGELMAFRSWRALHEWRNPSSDKRQAFRHWIGRVWRGRLIAPSGIMAELAPTKVPGEPLFQPDDGDWRPWLPLPDMILSAIDTGETVSLFTAEGVTEIEPPAGFFAQLRARLRLSWRFAHVAALRNWTEASGKPPTSYSEALREIGVRIRMQTHDNREPDRQLARFFSVGPALLLVPTLLEQAQDYFSSLYANTLAQLGLFLAAAACGFFLLHWLRNREMRRARAALPLVVGGWGTRGKSGTERLKAAVFSALGHPLICKTTGNEAMFLRSDPFGDVREMFLFRPYDKATIWEQLNLAVLARKLGAKVFLWECMGLTPSYVKVLQRHWMRDDIATITNTYPDHEDVQGPAGRNIPEVMTNFIPENSMLITSEEQMRPILAQAAQDLGTSCETVGWLEAGLIPDEFLARFPYEEHPYNIALVTAMARQIGVTSDVAVKEMADRVVQDIGALKVYPEAPVRGRRLEFVLGNSANERFGALGNWTRLGFDRQDPVAEPDLWITTVVNNRADRVPRSRVFASILVKDISADRHVLIGSNLQGLRGFIAEAWAELAPSLTLSPPERPDSDPLEELEALARRFRIVHCEDQLTAIIAAMRISGRPDEDGVAAHADRCRTQLAEYRAIESELRERGTTSELDSRLRDQLWAWFQAKIVVVENYHATGEEIIRSLTDMTPPGFRNRIMGMQNIKGTGLDFVYRWHAWETVYRACKDSTSDEPARIDRGLQTLAAFREYGVLSEETVLAAVEQIRARGRVGGELAETQLQLIATQLRGQLAAGPSATGPSGKGSRWIDLVEAFLDAGDAVRRRKKADRIYKELAAERISSDRAVAELKTLTSRQKGGWVRKNSRMRSLLS